MSVLNSGKISKIKTDVATLLTRLSATWAAKLDSLRTDYTAARAAKLDNLDTPVSGVGTKAVTARSPLYLPGGNTLQTAAGALVDIRDNTNIPRTATALTTSFQTILDLAGPGEVTFLAGGASETTWLGDGFWKVTIDGVVWIDGTTHLLDRSNADNRVAAMIGSVDYDPGASVRNIGFEPVPFKTSFKVEAKRSADGSSTAYTFYSYTLR